MLPYTKYCLSSDTSWLSGACRTNQVQAMFPQNIRSPAPAPNLAIGVTLEMLGSLAHVVSGVGDTWDLPLANVLVPHGLLLNGVLGGGQQG